MSCVVENETWGCVKVRLDNRICIEKTLLKQVVEKANLPKCSLLLIFDDKNGFQSITETLRGISFAEEDFDIAVTDNCQDEYIGQENNNARDEWDYAVYIPYISGQTWYQYKPYFVLVLGHELEHVRIMIEELCFHRCTSWLFESFRDDAIEGVPKTYEVPWEKHHYKMGKHIALKLDGESRVHRGLSEFAAFLKKINSKHWEIVEWLRGLDCSDVSAENILSIKKDTKDLCQKWRTILIRMWQHQRLQGEKIALRFNLPYFI